MISGWRGQGGARASSVSGLDIIMSEEDVSSEESKKDLVSFLAKVDEIGRHWVIGLHVFVFICNILHDSSYNI